MDSNIMDWWQTEQMNEKKVEKNVEKEKPKLLILTSDTNESNHKMQRGNTIQYIEKYCKKNDISYKVIFADKALIEKTDEKIQIYNFEEEDKFEISPSNTIIWPRRGIMFHTYSSNILLRLEKMGFFTINSYNSISICEDKYKTILKLTDANLPCPLSTLILNEKTIDISIDKIGGKFPVVVKTLSGSGGKGVFLADSKENILAVLQAIWSLNASTELLLQQKVENSFDLRCYVVNGEVIATGKRTSASKKDFRSNFSLNGKMVKYEASDEVKEIAIRAACAVNANVAGVDIILDKDENPYILEVNTSPGTEGISAASGVDIIDEIYKTYKDKDNWSSQTKEVGYKEKIKVDKIGELIAKFDTGCGTPSGSLDAQKIETEGNIVTWETNGKRYKNKISYKERIKDNEDSEKIKERVVIEIDLEFDGVVYKKTAINLNDRSHKTTQLLISRPMMKRLGVVINPIKDFIITQRD